MVRFGFENDYEYFFDKNSRNEQMGSDPWKTIFRLPFFQFIYILTCVVDIFFWYWEIMEGNSKDRLDTFSLM